MATKQQSKQGTEQATSGRVAYRPGDELTHATGRKRLNVSAEGGCVCGCGQTPQKRRSRFIPGHDARMYALAKLLKDKDPKVRKDARAKASKRQLDYLKGRNLI